MDAVELGDGGMVHYNQESTVVVFIQWLTHFSNCMTVKCHTSLSSFERFKCTCELLDLHNACSGPALRHFRTADRAHPGGTAWRSDAIVHLCAFFTMNRFT